MSEFAQQLLNGVTLGAVYALVALGFTMIFGVLELIAFAQGGVYMIGAYVGLLVASRLAGGWLLLLLIALPTAALAGGALNVAVDRIAYRPIRNSGRLAPLISGIGIYIFLQNGADLWLGSQPQPYPSVLPAGGFAIGGVYATEAQLVVILASCVCVFLLWYLVRRTQVGLWMRAVAERPAMASLMGIEPERVIIITFFVGGALAGVAGVLVGAWLGVATPVMGFLIGLKAFAAAVIGGIGNIPGALIGGIAIGLIETFGAGYISSAYSDAFVFIVLILVLMFRPHGILGVQLPERG